MAHHSNKSDSNILSAFFINMFFTIIELIGGLYTNSMAILSDAIHDLGDTISLGMSAFFERFSKKKADNVYTYGYDRFSLLGAVISSFVLFGASIFVLTQAIPRLLAPETVDARGMIAFATLGVVFNGFAVLKVIRGKSLHEKVITWHLLEDFLGWTAVLITSVILLFVDWYFLDPLLSILITFYIVIHVLRNLRSVFNVLLQKAPEDVNLEEAIEKIEALDGVYDIHHIHLWSLEGQTPMLSLHLVIDKTMSPEEIKGCKRSVRTILSNRKIHHVTIETEYDDERCVNPPCGDDSQKERPHSD
ncbi:MAG: cation diffusion facilitator family transporter [Bacillota bacterium]